MHILMGVALVLIYGGVALNQLSSNYNWAYGSSLFHVALVVFGFMALVTGIALAVAVLVLERKAKTKQAAYAAVYLVLSLVTTALFYWLIVYA